jgi:hypothetical protein
MGLNFYVRQHKKAWDQEEVVPRLPCREIHLHQLLEYCAFADYMLGNLLFNQQPTDLKFVALPSDLETLGSVPVNFFVFGG